MVPVASRWSYPPEHGNQPGTASPALVNGLGLDSCAIFVVRSESAGDAEVTPKVKAEDIDKVLIKSPTHDSWSETVSRGEPHMRNWSVGAMPHHYINRFQTFTGKVGFPVYPEHHYMFDRKTQTLKQKLEEFLEPAMTEEERNEAWWLEQESYDRCKQYKMLQRKSLGNL